jgi:uncharacterized repeat protein (TIGR03803 family)
METIKAKRAGYLNPACAVIVIGIAGAAALSTAGERVLHNFGSAPRGADPGRLIRDSAGNLYGTTYSGGTANRGVVFKIGPGGRSETVLYSFTGGADGGYPYAGVIEDSAGNLYGTTTAGGTADAGVVYMLDPAGHQTVLYSFTGGADGKRPKAEVIRDPDGNLYGTTYEGGTNGWGVVYMLDRAGRQTVLHNFQWEHSDGGVIRDPGGNLYGTTDYGGRWGYGSVYKIDSGGLRTAVYDFTGKADGANPAGGVIRDSAGNLYGTTSLGGASGDGVVYKIDPTGQETVLYSFTFGGWSSPAGVIRDSAGNLYGTVSGPAAIEGVVFKVDPKGHGTVLYAFTGGADGGYPRAGVTSDPAGNLYGTSDGGRGGSGVVYKVDPTGHETVLYSFPGGFDGQIPQGKLIRDSAGNLYGTTVSGGPSGAGVVYKVDATGQERVLYSFTGGADGGRPYAGLILDPGGNLYGTTCSGGASNAGVVYRVDPTGQETVLYSFTGGADGACPWADVILDASGNLYGTALSGGAANYGVVYMVDAGGHETVLHSFMGADGGCPCAGVILDAAGNLYGTTSSGWGPGVVYKLNPTRQFTVLHSFTAGTDGGYPNGLILDAAGNLYGTTSRGGYPVASAGVVYKLDPTGHETVLHNFTGGAGGRYPYAGVVQDSAGNLYGTTYEGGKGGVGVVFKLDPTGHETVLHSFTGGADGRYPYAGVIQDSAGNLYGTAVSGGSRGTGVVFVIRP